MYFSSRSGGPVWSRGRGYHQPDPTPPHIQRIITQSGWHCDNCGSVHGPNVQTCPEPVHDRRPLRDRIKVDNG